jgi:hypothetical protein
MNNLTRLLFLGAASSLVVSLTAQSEGGPRGGGPGHHGRPRGNPIVRAIDVDKNIVLSATELANASAAILALDTNADGIVSAAELRPLPPNPPARLENPNRPEKGPQHQRPRDPVMLALDADQNGELSASEITNAAASLKALDDNEDGQLAREEFRPLPPE